jgi:hypothetical protein
MFETILATALPILRDLLLTAAAGLLAYAMNRIQSHVTSF